MTWHGESKLCMHVRRCVHTHTKKMRGQWWMMSDARWAWRMLHMSWHHADSHSHRGSVSRLYRVLPLRCVCLCVMCSSFLCWIILVDFCLLKTPRVCLEALFFRPPLPSFLPSLLPCVLSIALPHSLLSSTWTKRARDSWPVPRWLLPFALTLQPMPMHRDYKTKA